MSVVIREYQIDPSEPVVVFELPQGSEFLSVGPKDGGIFIPAYPVDSVDHYRLGLACFHPPSSPAW
jgi:hypothetical protein